MSKVKDDLDQMWDAISEVSAPELKAWKSNAIDALALEYEAFFKRESDRALFKGARGDEEA